MRVIGSKSQRPSLRHAPFRLLFLFVEKLITGQLWGVSGILAGVAGKG